MYPIHIFKQCIESTWRHPEKYTYFRQVEMSKGREAKGYILEARLILKNLARRQKAQITETVLRFQADDHGCLLLEVGGADYAEFIAHEFQGVLEERKRPSQLVQINSEDPGFTCWQPVLNSINPDTQQSSHLVHSDLTEIVDSLNGLPPSSFDKKLEELTMDCDICSLLGRSVETFDLHSKPFDP